jgi:hypothetical protein
MRTTRDFLGRSTASRRRPAGAGLFAVLMPLVLGVVFVWPFGGGQKVQMTASREVPAAQGAVTVQTGHNNNTKVDIKVEYLAKPSTLTPPEDVYVVWFQPEGQAPKNEGELMVHNDLSGELKTETPYKHFKVFITAEKNPRVEEPEGAQVLTGTIAEH